MVLGGNHTGRSDRRGGPDAAARQFLASLLGSMPSRDYWVVIAGFDHPDCTDVPILACSLDPDLLSRKVRIMEVTRAYVRAFFESELQGKHSRLLDGPATAYPEATLRSFGPGR
jgi:hypothetical protein